MDRRESTSFWLIILLIGVVWVNIAKWYQRKYMFQEPKIDTVEVVRYNITHDKSPATRDEKVIGHVTLPVLSNSCKNVKKSQDFLHMSDDVSKKGDFLYTSCSKIPKEVGVADTLIQDSVPETGITLDIVQRKYTDDSTYTAYVSGLEYGSYPKLDSVIVRQKIIERTITNTIQERGVRFKLRPGLGGGYDPLNKGWGVYVGVAIIIDW